MKEVKKEVLLDIVFKSIESGKLIKDISKDLSISKQNLQYYLDKLKDNNRIKKIGYGTWETNKEVKTEVGRLVRGHGFMWHIKLPHEIKGWDKILERKGIVYKKINNNHTYQIYFKDNRIWLNKNSIVIYDIHSYFGTNAVDSRKYAFFELRTILNALQSKLGVNLQKNHNFILRVSRNHYSLVKNCLAVQCNKENKKINVSNENGLWFSIDNSYNLYEAETLHPQTALTDNLGIQKYFNEHKETGFQVTPKFTLNAINQLTNNQIQQAIQIGEYTKQIKSHLKLINEYRKENVSWRKNEIIKITKTFSNQKRLSEYG